MFLVTPMHRFIYVTEWCVTREFGFTISKHPSYVTDGRKPFKNQPFFALTDQSTMNGL